MKKFVLVLLMVMLVMACGCKTEKMSGDWVYTVEDGNACLVRYRNKTQMVSVPAQIDGYPVTELGEKLFSEEYAGIQYIEIPNSVKTIGDYAFSGCEGLVSITIPESVEKIGNYAFFRCNNLADIHFAGNTPEIGINALEDTLWYDKLPGGVVYTGTTAHSIKGDIDNCVIRSGTTHIRFGEFYCRTVRIPASVKEILPGAFEKSGLEKVYFEDGSEPLAIGEKAFSGCSYLKSIELPSRLFKIGDYAFENCGISYAPIPESVKDWGKGVFSGCPSIASVTIPGTMKEVPEKLFYGCHALETVMIDPGVEFVGMRAFSYCPEIVNVYIPDSVKRISSNAFWGKKTWDEPEFIHIYGTEGSYAEVFAHNHKFVFQDIEGGV